MPFLFTIPGFSPGREFIIFYRQQDQLNENIGMLTENNVMLV